MVKFGETITNEKEIYKICPNCRGEITPTMKSAYNSEWCPFCGLNHSEVFKNNKQ